MILSKQSLFSDDQAVTATTVSTNVIDLGVRGTPFGAVAPLHADRGLGCPIPVLIQVTEAFNTLTSLSIDVEVSDAAAMTNSTVVASETILLADLKAGKKTFLQVLPSGLNKRYLGLRYTVTGTPPTTGKITAGVSMGNQTNVTGA